MSSVQLTVQFYLAKNNPTFFYEENKLVERFLIMMHFIASMIYN